MRTRSYLAMLSLSAVDCDRLGIFDGDRETWESGGARIKVDGILAADHLVALGLGTLCSGSSSWSGLKLSVGNRRYGG